MVGLADIHKTSHLIEVNILHPYVLHHGCLLVNVWSDDAES